MLIGVTHVDRGNINEKLSFSVHKWHLRINLDNVCLQNKMDFGTVICSISVF